MKYRIVELLRCPDHPERMLRVTDAYLSEIFPFSGDLSLPVCRRGCGYLGNWFADIPESLPRTHRIDCRRCMGTEIESAVLTCPVCGWSLIAADGVLQACGDTQCTFADEYALSNRMAGPIEKHLDLHQQQLALVLAPLPDSTVRKWSHEQVERLQVELSSEVMLSGRAKCCANGDGMVHYLGGPLDISILRPEEYDALVATIPTERIAGWPEWFAQVPSLLRKSGRAVLVYPSTPESPRGVVERHNKIRQELPEGFNDLVLKFTEVPGADLLLVEHPEPENGFKLKIPRHDEC
jgi:hypothetical protein